MGKETEYVYGGRSDVGCGREVNEDYFHFSVIDSDVLLTVIADGMGSKPSTLQPAAICAMEVAQCVQRLYEHDKDVFLDNPTMMLKESLLCANRVLGAFKISNEEDYAGFGASISVLLLYDQNKIAFAHTGNTRISIIRLNQDGSPIVSQITEEFTDAMRMFYDGIISADEYYLHPDRYKLSSCIGFERNPEIQLYKGRLRKNDIVLMTTDGVHYGIRPEYMARFVLDSRDWEGATTALIDAAKMQMRSENAAVLPDNCTAVVLFISGEGSNS